MDMILSGPKLLINGGGCTTGIINSLVGPPFVFPVVAGSNAYISHGTLKDNLN